MGELRHVEAELHEDKKGEREPDLTDHVVAVGDLLGGERDELVLKDLARLGVRL